MQCSLAVTLLRSLLVVIAAVAATSCTSESLRGPGPANPPAFGHRGSRAAELPPSANSPSNYGWGSAYDPHPTGSRATTGRPSETGSIPPFWSLSTFGKPMGVPNKDPLDDKKKP